MNEWIDFTNLQIISECGTKLPNDRVYDGNDISLLLLGTGKSNRDIVFYYRGTQVYAIRKGDYKAHF